MSTLLPVDGGQTPKDEPIILPQLTSEEDTFCLAVLEYSGNLSMAYRMAFGEESKMPQAKARALLARPEIAGRIQDLTQTIQDNALISLGAHLIELADIRDLSKAQGNLKVALEAEKSRGVVAGFYVDKLRPAPGDVKTPEQVAEAAQKAIHAIDAVEGEAQQT